MRLVDGVVASKGSFVVATLLALTCSSRSWGQCGGQPGQEIWTAQPYDWTSQLVFVDSGGIKCAELEISHAALIPRGVFRGKVLLWRKERTNTPTTGCQDADTDVTWIFDPGNPTNLARINQSLSSDIFCGGLSHDRFGQLIVSGGVPSPECLPDPDLGCDDPDCTLPIETFRFQPQQLDMGGLTPGGLVIIMGNPWKLLGPMAIRRYYPTNITLGKVQTYRSDDFDMFGPAGSAEDAPLPLSTTMVAGGPACGGGEGNEFWELLPPAVTGATAWLAPVLPQNPMVSDPLYSQPNSPNYTNYPTLFRPPYDPYERPAGLASPDGKNKAQPLLDSYPRMFQTSFEGQILVCGDVETSTMATPNAAGSVWVIKPRVSTAIGAQAYWQDLNGPIGPANWHDSFYDTAVLLHKLPPSTKDRVIMFGGSRDQSGWTVNDKVWEFDKNEGASTDQIVQGTWREKPTGSTQFKRLYPNAIVLPTGDIFVEGGTTNDDTSGHCTSGGNPGCASVPVFDPIIYDPGSQASDAGTVHVQDGPPIPAGMAFQTARLYHHVAVLLPDGRIFIAGGKRQKDPNGVVYVPAQGYPDPRFSGEIFSPPYLDFTGLGRARPRFETPLPPTEVLFGNSFEVTVRHSAGLEIDKIVLLRPAAVTHHWDADQRYIELDFFVNQNSTVLDGGEVLETFTVQSPDMSLGPAGYYMLFAVEDDLLGTAPCTIEGHRIPSVAHFINIQ